MVPAVRWPTAVDYQTVLQIPPLCFDDPSLRQGSVLADALGVPLAASGNVVVVFRMKLERGEVAVRCFTRQSSFEALKQRYEAWNTHLTFVHLPALVESRYRPDALRIGEHRYGIVLMDWVRGQHLHRYVEQHLADAGVIHALADRWRLLMVGLRTARIAHGDLSDGNILVDGKGRLRLIDYDAAYIPALKAVPSTELGKPNYQHPARLRPNGPFYGYYGEDMDAFSALVIYLSLRALADDPARWERYHTGENLLFVADDYARPGYTPIWQDLRDSRDAEVCGLTDVLAQCCHAPVSGLPTLEAVLNGLSPRPMRGRGVPEGKEEEGEATPAVSEGARAQERPAEARPPREAGKGPGRTAPWRRPVGIGIGVALLLVAAFGLLWIASGQVQKEPAPQSQEATAMPGEPDDILLDPEELVGFYTGYATSPDGTKEALALTLSLPETLAGGSEARLSYSLNRKTHQSGGVGRYDRATGLLNLENRYELYVAYAGKDGVVLASTDGHPQAPRVKVNKRKTL